jgi:hypothetical protein
LSGETIESMGATTESIEFNSIVGSSASIATNRTKPETVAITLNSINSEDQNQMANNLTSKQQKELLLRQQAHQMLSAYNCPPSYRNEF